MRMQAMRLSQGLTSSPLEVFLALVVGLGIGSLNNKDIATVSRTNIGSSRDHVLVILAHRNEHTSQWSIPPMIAGVKCKACRDD